MHVEVAAGDDAEPAWDRTFRRTYDFFRGFGAAGSGHLLYDYGSLDGGPAVIWNVRQAYYVAGVMTQHTNPCRRCGVTPAEAQAALVDELAKSARTRVRMLAAATNIDVPARPRFNHAPEGKSFSRVALQSAAMRSRPADA